MVNSGPWGPPPDPAPVCGGGATIASVVDAGSRVVAAAAAQ